MRDETSRPKGEGRTGPAQAAGGAGGTTRPRKPRATNAPPLHGSGPGGRLAAKTSEVVYQDLKQEIIALVRPPGSPILEKAVTDRYGISRTPFREAILRLAEERLVDVVAKSGTFVSRIALADLREAIVARRALEETTAREAARRATRSGVLAAESIIQRQSEVAEAGDEEAFHLADQAFHQQIAEMAGLPGLWTLVQQIRVQVERYRRLTLPQPGRMAAVVGEHRAILDAVSRRDEAGAAAAMAAHLDKLKLDIAVFRDLWPAYFVYEPGTEDDFTR